MNLDKHIDRALTLYQDAFSKLDAWEREKRTAFKNHRQSVSKLTEEAATEEYLRITKEYNDRLRAIVETLEGAISAVEMEYSQDIKIFYAPSGSAIDTADQALLASGILTHNEVETMAVRHSDNPTMLRIIGKYAAENRICLSPQMERAVVRASNGGENERRVWDAFKQLIQAPVKMAERGNAGTTAFMNSALNADEYAADAKAKLLHSKLYMSDVDKSAATQLAEKEIAEQNKKYDPHGKDYGWR